MWVALLRAPIIILVNLYRRHWPSHGSQTLQASLLSEESMKDQ